MSKKPTEINPVRAERVKILMKRENINQTQLAELIPQTQQNISRILTNKQPLTEENAKRIVELFPGYRLQWLLGYDDVMTQTDQLRTLIHNRVDTAEAINQVIRSVADDICFRENIPRPEIPFIYDFSILQTQLHEYAELIVSDYLKNRENSRFWKRMDAQYKK